MFEIQNIQKWLSFFHNLEKCGPGLMLWALSCPRGPVFCLSKCGPWRQRLRPLFYKLQSSHVWFVFRLRRWSFRLKTNWGFLETSWSGNHGSRWRSKHRQTSGSGRCRLCNSWLNSSVIVNEVKPEIIDIICNLLNLIVISRKENM